MALVRLKGIKTTRKKLADGTVKVFRYLRANNEPLVGEIGTPEFVASYAAAGAKLRTAPSGQFRSIIAKYKVSIEFKDKAAKTQKDYLCYIKRIEDEFGDMPIAAVNDPEVRGVFMEWRDGMAANRRKADYSWSVLGLILSWAKNRRLLTHNACEKGGRVYKGGDRAAIIWTPDDLIKLFAVASKDMITAVILAIWTGQREGDLLRLSWSAYDGKTIKLKQNKGKKNVVVPVAPTLKTFLDALPRVSTQILTNIKKAPWTEDGFKTGFGRTKEKAEIVNRTFHDLRGTAVTRLALAGCSVPEIASITGHSLKDVEHILDKHYLGGRVELAERAVLKLESMFGTPVETGTE